MDKSTKIYVAGHRGLVGSAIWNNGERIRMNLAEYLEKGIVK